VSPSRLNGRALYALYGARFAYRHRLAWDAMHAHERRTWSSLAADVLDAAVSVRAGDTRRWLDKLKQDPPVVGITSEEIVQSIHEGRDERCALDHAHEDVPADVVELLRAGLYTNLARACEDAPVTMPEAHTHAGWADVLVRIEGASRALDTLGWDTPTQDTKVELDAAMIAALEAEIDTWEWLAEQDRLETAEGRRRAATKARTIKRFLASVMPPEIVSRADAETTDGDA
jgi:hypothetical protein